MKADSVRILALLAALLASVGMARGEELLYGDMGAPPGDQVRLTSATANFGGGAPCNTCPTACNTCDTCDGGRGRWFADFDATFFRYHRNDNLQSDNIFDFDFSPRIAFGYMNDDGFGVRARWWDYDHDGTGLFNGLADTNIRVKTYNVDLELFQNIQFSECTAIEICGGIRYNDFRETIADAGDDVIQEDIFSGVGAIFGVKGRRSMLGGNVYARWSLAMIASDHTAIGGHGLEFDQTLTQTEIGLGFERATCLANGSIVWWRAGLEVSNWTDYVHDNANPDDNTAIGFTGAVLGAGILF